MSKDDISLVLYETMLIFYFFRVRKKVEKYEYDEAMEPAFRKSLFKTFNKTLEEGFFPLIVVDAVNHKVVEVMGS